MSEDSKVMDVLVQRSDKLAKRRQFFRSAGGVGLGLIGGTILGACGGGSSSASAQSGPTDPEILNFALNLEYLEATFYAYATTGAGLPASLMSGAGTAGTVIPGHAVTFSDPVVQAYANEIAKDELEHVTFLRTALGASAVAMPALDVGYQNPNGAFSKAAQAAGLVPAGTAFDPYLNDETFLLAAFIFEDVGVTAYKGAAPLISNSTYLSAAAGILAAEAYHAGLVRTTLYAKVLRPRRLALLQRQAPSPTHATRSTTWATTTRALQERRRASPTLCRSIPTASRSAAITECPEHRLPDECVSDSGRLLPGRRQRYAAHERLIEVGSILASPRRFLSLVMGTSAALIYVDN